MWDGYNEDLAGCLYSEDTLEDAILVKNILMWIEHRSFLGRWNKKGEHVKNVQEKEMSKILYIYNKVLVNLIL